VSNGTPFPTRRATAPAGDDSRLLEEASRIADTVRNRFSELERREQQITEQLSAFDQEQRRFRLMQQQYHDELVDRDAELKRREQKFGERLTHGQQVLAQLQAREQELERLTGGLEQQRANLRAEIGQELEVERAALKHSKSLVDAERQELSDQAEKMRNEHQITMRQFRRDLEGERRRLRSQLASDIETEQQTFESQRAEWKQARETAEAELQREREAHKEAVRRVELELAEGRDRSIQEVEAARAKLEAERRDLEHGLEAERGALRQAREEVERAAIDQKATLAERRAALDAEAEKDRETALAEVRRSWDEERSQLARELAGDIGAKKQQLAAEIAEFEARQSREMTALEEIRETQEATLRQARSELVEYKRQAEEQRAEDLAAHHAHLTAARGQFEIELQNRLGAREEELRQQIAEFEGQKRKHHEAVEQATQALVTERDAIGREQAAWQQSRGQEEERLADQRRQTHVSQHALDVHRQQFRAESIRRQETLERRLQQLGRFREVLTQREESIERERQVLMQSREQFSSELEVDRQSLVEQAADIERQRNELAADTQHQTQQLDRERQKLQERSECLDQLRRELEQVSVQNLEFRLAAQEALAELTSQVGSQTAEQRVAAVRPVIAGQIRELHDVTGESSTARMVAIAQRQVEEQTSQLKEERTTFARRMNEREQELHEQESRLENRLHDWEQRESRWRHMRDDWLNEKLNAEQIIRSLLDELSVA
jgi:chromosome segregation ATPase